MKKITLILLLFSVSVTYSSAQHLALKGHQINGNVEDFINSLVRDGFWQDPSNQGLLYGTYCNIPATFTFVSSSVTSTVYQVEVSITQTVKEELDFKKYWHSLNNNQKRSIIKSDKYDYNRIDDDCRVAWGIIQDAELNNPTLQGLVAEKTLEYTKKQMRRIQQGNIWNEGLYQKEPTISLYQAYFDVKDALTKLYGKPQKVKEKKEYNEYDCVFSISSGTIEVRYGGLPYIPGVTITLTDKQNEKISKKERSQLDDMSKENRANRANVNVLDL